MEVKEVPKGRVKRSVKDMTGSYGSYPKLVTEVVSGDEPVDVDGKDADVSAANERGKPGYYDTKHERLLRLEREQEEISRGNGPSTKRRRSKLHVRTAAVGDTANQPGADATRQEAEVIDLVEDNETDRRDVSVPQDSGRPQHDSKQPSTRAASTGTDVWSTRELPARPPKVSPSVLPPKRQTLLKPLDDPSRKKDETDPDYCQEAREKGNGNDDQPRRSQRAAAARSQTHTVIDPSPDGDGTDAAQPAEEIDPVDDDPDTSYFQYPLKMATKARGAIVVTAGDFARLRPETYLNDTIIDFWMKRLQDLADARKPEKYHFFNSFFFRRLVKNSKDIDYEGVKRWTNDVDIFEKKYVVIPVCDLAHWSLVVLVNIGLFPTWRKGESRPSEKPVILYYDSMHHQNHKTHLSYIKQYLTQEWSHRKTQLTSAAPDFSGVSSLCPRVPQQDNEYDCGLFCLMYAEKMIWDAPRVLTGKLVGRPKWFEPVDVLIFREKLRAEFLARQEFETLIDENETERILIQQSMAEFSAGTK